MEWYAVSQMQLWKCLLHNPKMYYSSQINNYKTAGIQ